MILSSLLKVTSAMSERLSRFAYYAEIGNALMVAAALALGVIGFQSDQKRGMERYTFDYAQNYFAPTMLESRQAVRERILTIEKLDPKISNNQLASLLADTFTASTDKVFSSNIVAITDYFNGAKGCVDARLCDPNLMRTLHSDEASSLACLLGPTLKLIAFSGGEEILTEGLVFFAENENCDELEEE